MSEDIIQPYFENSKNAICIASSNEYAMYLCVYLTSLKNYSDSNKFYDIIIFERDITSSNKRTIVKAISAKNISVRFYNPTPKLQNLHMYVTHSYFKEECYYRICAPAVLKNYSKVIFTDLDLILKDDILKLAEIDMGQQPIAACLDPIWKDMYAMDLTIKGYQIREYAESVLKLSDPAEKYYNSGIVVFNVKKFNEMHAFYALQDLINKNRFLYQEQCALNKFFNGMFVTLSPIWNFAVDVNIPSWCGYREHETNAKILHYIGCNKPWENPMVYSADSWWMHARQTPFYEELLKQLILPAFISKANDQTNALISKAINQTNCFISTVNTQTNTNIYLTYVLSSLTFFKLKKNAYRMLKLFTWGKVRQRFTQKHRKTKEIIKAANTFKRSLSKSVAI